ncbi:MAG: tRNA (guanosine(37)-N1)-methyltransferase TrmD [Christensenellales bacterium]
MRIDVLTLFPEMFAPLSESIIGKAREKGLIEINVTDIREFSADKHKKCDDYPVGGGAGMVMLPQPIFDAVNAVDPDHEALRIYMSPKGKRLDMPLVKSLAAIESKRILLLCGHYEGVDQRVLDLCFDDEISIGDYVLTGGELPAMVVIDCVARYIDGVLGSEDSVKEESFSSNTLEYPQYTRPAVFEGISVPDVLLSGHHANVEKWRREQSEILTKKLRPDLLED